MIEFSAVSETLSDQSKVWNVRGVQEHQRFETPEGVIVVEFNCVDQEHADALVELLEKCVETSAEYSPVVKT